MRDTGRWCCGVSGQRLGGQGAVSCAAFDTVGFHAPLFGGRPGWLAVLCLAVLVVLLSGGASPSWAQDPPMDGDLRLRGGLSDNEGRLEILYEDEWGTVCDDFFGMTDAQVACKQLDYTGAAAVLTDVEVAPDRRFWLDDVNCIGNEMKLTDCFYNNGRVPPPWGIANCVPAEQVGVRCTTTNPTVFLSRSSLTVTEQDSAATYSVWLGKAPTANVTMTIASNNTDVTASPPSLTFTQMNWNVAQTVEVAAMADMDQNDDTVTLTHTASGGGYDDAEGDTDLAVTVKDDDVPGVRVRPQSLTVREQDTSGRTYEVVLTGEPANNVTITIAGHSGTDVSVNLTSLTFTPMNWGTEKTVRVKAGNDADTTNDRVSLTHSATSTDGDYDGITIAGVTVRVTDNDIAQVTGVSVAPGNGQLVVSWTAVDNATGYRVQWKSGGQNYNTTDRQFTVTSSSTTSHTIIGLTNGTEYTVQVIATRTGANDGPPSEEMTGTPMAAGVMVSKTTLTVTEEDTTGDSYTVVLDSQPTANVTVTVAGHAGTDVTPTPASLTFTRMSWATAQTVTVTVTAGNDADTTDDTVTLTHSAASTDSDYDGITIAGVTVTDNDTDGGGGGGGGTGGGGGGGGGGGAAVAVEPPVAVVVGVARRLRSPRAIWRTPAPTPFRVGLACCRAGCVRPRP